MAVSKSVTIYWRGN